MLRWSENPFRPMNKSAPELSRSSWKWNGLSRNAQCSLFSTVQESGPFWHFWRCSFTESYLNEKVLVGKTFHNVQKRFAARNWAKQADHPCNPLFERSGSNTEARGRVFLAPWSGYPRPKMVFFSDAQLSEPMQKKIRFHFWDDFGTFWARLEIQCYQNLVKKHTSSC